MLTLTTQQLEQQGVTSDELLEASQIKCGHKVFVRGGNFFQTDREKAIKLCQKYIKEGIFSFLSETDIYITVWREEVQNQVEKPTRVLSTKTTITPETSKQNFSTNYDIYIRQLNKTETEVSQSSSTESESEINELESITENQVETSTSTVSEAIIQANNSLRQYRGISYESQPTEAASKETTVIKQYRGITYEETQAPSYESSKAVRRYRGITY